MADNDFPDFKILLAELPQRFEHLANETSQASSSSAQASAVQPEPSKNEPDQAQSSKGAVARVASFNVSNARLGLVEEGEQTFPGDLTESEMSDEYKGEHPDSSNDPPLPEFDDPMSNHDPDTDAGTPSTSREGRIEPSMSELMELAAGLVLSMAASSEPPAERSTSPPLDHALAQKASIRSTSPPLDHALAQKASIRSYKKPSASPLHNEIHGSPADNNQQALQRDYKQDLASAGEADKVMLDLPDKLLGALVDTQEAELREGAEHVVAASEIKNSGHELSVLTISKELAELLNTDIRKAALLEFDNSLADPSYNATAAREKFALSKGVKLDSVEVYNFFCQYQELQTSHYSSKSTTTQSDAKMAMLEQLAWLELQAFNSGKGTESELTMEDATTSEVKDKESDSLVEDSATAKVQGKGKGKGKKSGKGKKKKSKLPMDDATTGQGESKERDMLVEGSAVDEGKGKGNEFTLEDATTGKGKAKESNVFVKDQASGKGKGKENDLPVEDTTGGKGKESNVFVKDQANGKGKGKENDLPVEDTTGGKGKESDQSNSGAFRKSKFLNLNTAPKSAPSSALPIDLGGPREIFDHLLETFQAQSTPTKEDYVAARMHLYSLMGHTIRDQKASPEQLELMCRVLSVKVVFDSMSRYIEELRWNRAVVQHPNNPMITEILQRTQHLRPTNGLHHPSGTSVAPRMIPQNPPLPPGPAPPMPDFTTPTQEQLKKEQPKKERTGIKKLQQMPIKVKLPFEDSLQVLDLREATIMAKIKDGVPMSAATVIGDLTAINQSKRHLKEKARLEIVGGPIADMLVERQKKMAEASGAPAWLLPSP